LTEKEAENGLEEENGEKSSKASWGKWRQWGVEQHRRVRTLASNRPVVETELVEPATSKGEESSPFWGRNPGYVSWEDGKKTLVDSGGPRTTHKHKKSKGAQHPGTARDSLRKVMAKNTGSGRGVKGVTMDRVDSFMTKVSAFTRNVM